MINVREYTKEDNIKSKGVYLIAHKCTDIKYVGSTITSFQERWRAHLNGLKRNKGNRVLLNIYHKYGIEGFEFFIIENLNECSKDFIRERESYWIEYYDTYNNGANCSKETKNALLDFKRQPYTEERKKLYVESSTTKKTVYLYDIKGVLVNTFCSSCACDRFLNIKKGRTNWAIHHPFKSVKGYYPSFDLKIWCPEKEIKKKIQNKAISVARTRKMNGTYKVQDTQKNKIKESNPKRKEVTLYDLNNNFIAKFISLNECDVYLNLTKGSTSKVLKGKAKTLKKQYIPKLI